MTKTQNTVLAIAFALVFADLMILRVQANPVTQCMDLEGNIYEVPKKQKVVLVPHWVDANQIVIPLRPASDIKPRDQPKKCDPNDLVVSPSICED